MRTPKRIAMDAHRNPGETSEPRNYAIAVTTHWVNDGIDIVAPDLDDPVEACRALLEVAHPAPGDIVPQNGSEDTALAALHLIDEAGIRLVRDFANALSAEMRRPQGGSTSIVYELDLDGNTRTATYLP